MREQNCATHRGLQVYLAGTHAPDGNGVGGSDFKPSTIAWTADLRPLAAQLIFRKSTLCSVFCSARRERKREETAGL